MCVRATRQAINWFFNWPSQALISVAQRFLGDVEMESDELRNNVANHMAFVHESVGLAAEQYRRQLGAQLLHLIVTIRQVLLDSGQFLLQLSVLRSELLVCARRARGSSVRSRRRRQ